MNTKSLAGQLTAGQMLGRYEMLLPIAAGGMGNVWAARLKGTRGFRKLVAVKTVLHAVDDEKLEQTTGFWWSPTVKGFHFAEVESVSIVMARGPKNREYEAWVVTLKDGGTRQIDPGDLWDMNRADIVRRLRLKGVEVQDLEREPGPKTVPLKPRGETRKKA